MKLERQPEADLRHQGDHAPFLPYPRPLFRRTEHVAEQRSIKTTALPNMGFPSRFLETRSIRVDRDNLRDRLKFSSPL